MLECYSVALGTRHTATAEQTAMAAVSTGVWNVVDTAVSTLPSSEAYALALVRRCLFTRASLT